MLDAVSILGAVIGIVMLVILLYLFAKSVNPKKEEEKKNEP